MKLTQLFFLAVLLPATASATLQTADSKAATPAHTSIQLPRLSARSYLLYDYSSKQFLLEQNSHERIEPSALTMLMTAYITFSALKLEKIALNQRVTPSIRAVQNQRSEYRMFLDFRKTVTIGDLVHGLTLIAAHDAARTLAETIAGNEASFTELMNLEAQRIGMKDTHFSNATGLADPLHHSSAYDLALLTAAILHDFPEHLALFSMREYEYNQVKHYNRNRLLWLDPNVDGIHAGHAESTGYSLVATAKRNDHRLLSVVLGSGTEHLRSAESQRLLNHGYQDYELFYLYNNNDIISSIRLWKGTENTVKVGVRGGLTVTLPKGQRALLKATIETQQPLLAPIEAGQQVGILKLSLDSKPFQEFPLVALNAVPLVNIFSRGIDSIRMIFNR